MRVRRSFAAMLFALVVVAALPIAALGDGDPASDILPGGDLYVPYQQVDRKVQSQLAGLLAAAKKDPVQGTAFKVAVIATPQDLGAYPFLFGKNKQYVNLLYKEIKTFVDGSSATLLTIMPGKQGAAAVGNLDTPATQRALAKISFPKNASATELAQGAMTAMAAVAKANGRELPDAPGTGGGGSDTTTIIVIVGAVALALAGIALFIRGRRGPPAPATGAA
jgi:hypothetical protein